jgi:hypothetical protein
MLTLLGACLFNQLKQMQRSGGNLPAWLAGRGREPPAVRPLKQCCQLAETSAAFFKITEIKKQNTGKILYFFLKETE